MLFFLTGAVSRLVKMDKKSAVFQNLLGLGIPLILCFYSVIKEIFSPLILPPGECHCNMGVLKRQGKCYDNLK